MKGHVRRKLREKKKEVEIKLKSFKKKPGELKTRIKKRIKHIKDSEWDFSRELGRKLIHLLSILYVLIYLIIEHYLGSRAGLLALCGLLIVLLELEYVRIELKAKLPILSFLWSHFKRRSESQRLGGEIFFLLGAIMVYSIFDVRIATTAVLMTTFGDLSASLIGKYFGRTWLSERKKIALEGVIAQFIVDLIVGFVFLRTIVDNSVWWLSGTTIVGDPMWWPIFAMALVATFVETCVTKIDDNLLIPLFSGFTGHLVLVILSYSIL